MSGEVHVIACPQCDTMYRIDDDTALHPSLCTRCGHRLTYGRREAIAHVVGLAGASAVLLVLALFLPFLQLSRAGRNTAASLVEVVAGFTSGIMVPLGVLVIGFIIVLPLTRLLLLVFSLGPVAVARTPFHGAEQALRWAFALKPWAMAEIFLIGVAVALVKLAGLATVGIGTAFWVFVAVVLLSALQETYMCRHTLWTELTAARG